MNHEMKLVRNCIAQSSDSQSATSSSGSKHASKPERQDAIDLAVWKHLDITGGAVHQRWERKLWSLTTAERTRSQHQL